MEEEEIEIGVAKEKEVAVESQVIEWSEGIVTGEKGIEEKEIGEKETLIQQDFEEGVPRHRNIITTT